MMFLTTQLLIFSPSLVGGDPRIAARSGARRRFPSAWGRFPSRGGKAIPKRCQRHRTPGRQRAFTDPFQFMATMRVQGWRSKLPKAIFLARSHPVFSALVSTCPGQNDRDPSDVASQTLRLLFLLVVICIVIGGDLLRGLAIGLLGGGLAGTGGTGRAAEG